MKKNWVDFKEIKERVKIEDILSHYGIKLNHGGGSELVGFCPFHEESRPSFRVNTAKNVFHCFGCGAKGNVLDFVAQKESVDVRKAALLLKGWFDTSGGEKAPYNANEVAKTGVGEAKNSKSTVGGEKSGVNQSDVDDPGENKVLTFELRLEGDHPYFRKRGIDEELRKNFGLGYCNRGLMKGRIAIPIHNEKGELVAYAGRWPGDKPPEGEERYMLPPGFKKNLVLFNLHRVVGSKHLTVVEGYWSVFRLHKLGIPAVALMGLSLSKRQEELLVESGARRITVLLDGDDAGRTACGEILLRLSRRFLIKVVELPDGIQPDTADESLLQTIVDEEDLQ